LTASSSDWNLPKQPPPGVYSHQIETRCVADQASS